MNPRFDPSLFTNHMDPWDIIDRQISPDGDVQNSLDLFISDTENQITHLENQLDELLDDVECIHMKSGTIIEDTQNLASKVIEQINDLSEKVNELNESTAGASHAIQKYDVATKNLKTTIVTYRRIQMAQQAVKQLEEYSRNRNFKECAANIQALSALSDFFKKFGPGCTVLENIIKRFDEQKILLKKVVDQSFQLLLFGNQVTQSFSDVCLVIDALDIRDEIIDRFLEIFLNDYDTEMKNISLGDFNSRVTWLLKKREAYIEQYDAAFPKTWPVYDLMAWKFCTKTRSHLTKLLQKPDLKGSAYQSAFQTVVALEKKFDSDFSFEEIADGSPTKKFQGVMSQVFANKLDLYFQIIDNDFSAFIAKTSNDIDSSIRILKSGVELTELIRKKIQECSLFSSADATSKLFFHIRNAIEKYTTKISSFNTDEINSVGQLRLYCYIGNTLTYFNSNIDGLVKQIKSQLPDDYSAGISAEDLKDIIQGQRTVLLDKLLLTVSCSPSNAFSNLGKKGVDEKFANAVVDTISKNYKVLTNVLDDNNKQYTQMKFCFIIAPVIFDCIFNQPLVMSDLEPLSKLIIKLKKFLNSTAKGAFSLAQETLTNTAFQAVDGGLQLVKNASADIPQLFEVVFRDIQLTSVFQEANCEKLGIASKSEENLRKFCLERIVKSAMVQS